MSKYSKHVESKIPGTCKFEDIFRKVKHEHSKYLRYFNTKVAKNHNVFVKARHEAATQSDI